MKVIIAGSRSIINYRAVRSAIERVGIEITEVVSGTARGVDKLGERWAAENNIPIKRFPADWNKHDKRAGYLRNVEMAEYADALIAIWDGESKGTKHMIDIAIKNGLSVYRSIGLGNNDAPNRGHPGRSGYGHLSLFGSGGITMSPEVEALQLEPEADDPLIKLAKEAEEQLPTLKQKIKQEKLDKVMKDIADLFA